MSERVIENGIIDKFFTFEIFDNTKGDLHTKYVSALNKLVVSEQIISDIDYSNGVTLSNTIEEQINRRKEYLFKNINSLNRSYKGDFLSPKESEFTFAGFGRNPFIHPKNKVIDLLEYSQLRALHQFVQTNKLEEYHTSVRLLDTKNNFMLYPIRIVWNDDNVAFIDLTITTYKHGYAILNASIRFTEKRVYDIGDDAWNMDIKEAYFPKMLFSTKNEKEYSDFEYKKVGRCKSIDDALDRYLEILQGNIFTYESECRNFNVLTTNKFPGTPKNFAENSCEDFEESVYSLICAPISFKQSPQKIREYLSKVSKVDNENIKLFANQHRLLILFAKDFYKELEKRGVDNEEYKFELMYSGFRGGYIFAIEKLLLKQYTEEKFILKSLNKNLSLGKLYKLYENRDYELRYETNQIFYRFASTRDLITFLYEKCLDGNLKLLYQEHKDRTLELINLRKEKRVAQFSVLGPVVTIIISLVLSMSGINEILKVFGKENSNSSLIGYIVFNAIIITIVLLAYIDQLKRGIMGIVYTVKDYYRFKRAMKNTMRYKEED
jgi:hypothetical protein